MQCPGRFASLVAIISASVSIAALISVATVTCAAAAPVSAKIGELPLDAVASINQIDTDTIVASHDGGKVAFEVLDPSRAMASYQDHQLYTDSGYPIRYENSFTAIDVVDVQTGALLVVAARGANWAPSWSPDGRYLAFYSDRSGQAQLWLWDSVSGASRPICATTVRAWLATDRPKWSPDGRTVLFKSVPAGWTIAELNQLNPAANAYSMKLGPKSNAVSVHVYSTEAPTTEGISKYLDYGILSDLSIADVSTGAVRTVAKSVHAKWFSFSPKGGVIAFSNIEHLDPDLQEVISLNIASLQAPSPVKLLRYTSDLSDQSTAPTWSPAGTYLEYETHHPDGTGEIVVSKVGGRSVPVARFASHSASVSPIWSGDETSLYFLDGSGASLWRARIGEQPETNFLSVPYQLMEQVILVPGSSTRPERLAIRTRNSDSSRDGLILADAMSAEYSRIFEEHARLSALSLVGTASMSGVVFIKSNSGHPDDLWYSDLGEPRPRQITHLNPRLEQVRLGLVDSLSWFSLRGEKLSGALLLPSNYRKGQRYPLVVWVYGGQLGRTLTNAFGLLAFPEFNMQVLATRGYAVLVPDIPLHRGTPLKDVRSAVMPAVQAAIASGIADSHRLAIMGQSFGGYNVLGLLTSTHEFGAAIVSSASASNLFEGYARFDPASPSAGAIYYEHGQGSMLDTPWKVPHRYFQNSPFFHFDQITTPVLLERGSNDEISLDTGAVFNSLRRLGKDVAFLQYDFESHGLTRPVDVVDFWNRRLSWLQTHLR